MTEQKLTREEIENLGYYDFMAYLGIAYFHWGGMAATDQLFQMCDVNSDSKVLIVGSGTGYSACYIAEKIGCEIVGIDIAELMVETATKRVLEMGLEDRVKFHLGDIHELPFEDASFDVVLSQFVTVFLDRPRAFSEYARVLRMGGKLGMNELYRDDHIPDEPLTKILKAESDLREALELPLILLESEEWLQHFLEAGFTNVQREKVTSKYTWSEYSHAVGGRVNVLKMVFRVLYYVMINKKLRKRYFPVGRAKDVLARHKDTKEYAGSILIV
ncbi:MAG: class I SAM-dependent methyltransferase, partial [Candidatus Hodarchaeota archaeon]